METFIGMGPNPNPNVPDIPLGFGMQLAQNPKAYENFGILSDSQKTQIIKHIQTAQTGDDAKEKIEQAILKLEKGENYFDA